MVFYTNRLDFKTIAVLAAVGAVPVARACDCALAPNAACITRGAAEQTQVRSGIRTCCDTAGQEMCDTEPSGPDVKGMHVCGCDPEDRTPGEAVFTALPVPFAHKPSSVLVTAQLPLPQRFLPCAHNFVVAQKDSFVAACAPPHYLAACSLLI